MNVPDRRAMIVHILKEGLPLCRFSLRVPREWPAGHLWTDDKRLEVASCGLCLAVQRGGVAATDRLQALKNEASARALELYVQTLRRHMTDDQVLEALAETEHVHDAVALFGDKPLAAVVRWTFTRREDVAAAIVGAAGKRNQA